MQKGKKWDHIKNKVAYFGKQDYVTDYCHSEEFRTELIV